MNHALRQIEKSCTPTSSHNIYLSVTTSITRDSGQQENPRATTFGMRLRQERERRGITLDQITQSTKIGTRFLQALEQDHFEQLPGGIFNKGFVRAYASFVGLDEDQVVADYLSATGATEQKPEAPEGTSRAETPAGQEPDRAAGLPWGVFAILLLIAAFSFALWGFYARVSSKRKEMPPPSPPPPAQTSAAPAEPSPPRQATAQPTHQLKPSSKSVAPSALGSASQPAAAPSPSSGKPPASSVIPAEPPTPRDLVLQIKAREDAWISVTVDGEVTTQQVLAASAERTIRARREIVIRAGNAGALDFEFKGQPVPVQGATGEVKTLAFDANGWHVVAKPASTPGPESQSQP
jgi:cytoskeleton protein RodZ